MNPAAMQKRRVRSLGREVPLEQRETPPSLLEKGVTVHCSAAWEARGGGAWWPQPMGSQRVRLDLRDCTVAMLSLHKFQLPNF